MTPHGLTIHANSFAFDALSIGSDTGDLVLFLHGFPDFAQGWIPVMEPVAAKGFRAVAINQRGYSPGARPANTDAYQTQHLVSDVLECATQLGANRFHLVGHDWGAFIAWMVAAGYPERVRSLCALSTPHPNALLRAIATDPDQQQRSKYIEFFRMTCHAAEAFFEAENWKAFRKIYQGIVPEARIQKNVDRFSQPGALTAALNWYRALQLNASIGPVSIPALFIWGSDDLAAGEVAANDTAAHVTGPYSFERLDGKSHWMLDEVPEWIATRISQHMASF